MYQKLALLSVVVAMALAQDLSQLDGDQIVTLMQTFGDKCPSPADGQNWAPIPESIACGSAQRCDFPKEWCAYKAAADGTPDLQTLACQKLKDECTKAFDDAVKDGSLVAPPKSTPPSEEGSPTPTPATDEGSSTPPPDASPTPPAEETTNPQSVDQTSPIVDTSPTPQNSEASSPPPSEGTTPAASTPAASTPAASGGSSAAPDGGTTIPPLNGECCDYHEYCCFWASLGQCESNKLFMIQLCQSSCGTCGCTKDTLADCSITVAAACAAGNVTSTEVCPCKSTDLINRDWHKSCTSWAAGGGCDTNSQFMKPMCKKSCKICK